jgi:hypothetical protein
MRSGPRAHRLRRRRARIRWSFPFQQRAYRRQKLTAIRVTSSPPRGFRQAEDRLREGERGRGRADSGEALTIIDGNAHEDTGFDAHLTKPVVLADLLAICARLHS